MAKYVKREFQVGEYWLDRRRGSPSWQRCRFNTQTRAQDHTLTWIQSLEFDVLQLDKLRPGSISAQKVGHALGGIHRDAICVRALAAKMDKPHIVANMRVRQQDARE